MSNRIAQCYQNEEDTGDSKFYRAIVYATFTRNDRSKFVTINFLGNNDVEREIKRNISEHGHYFPTFDENFPGFGLFSMYDYNGGLTVSFHHPNFDLPICELQCEPHNRDVIIREQNYYRQKAALAEIRGI